MCAAAMVSIAIGCGCLAPAAALTWTQHTQPLAGELVLTDVHAILDGTSGDVVALATGEGGVVLKLRQAPQVQGGAWTTLLDTSYPTYWCVAGPCVAVPSAVPRTDWHWSWWEWISVHPLGSSAADMCPCPCPCCLALYGAPCLSAPTAQVWLLRV